MNKQQKEVLQNQLNEEKRALKELELIYKKAAEDTADKIAELSSREDLENLQSIVYQKKYQEAIAKQIQSTLEKIQNSSYDEISDYLNKCYESGYVGAMYDLMGQGVPIVMPIDPKDVKRALEINSKLSTSLYNRLGEDVSYLKKAVRSEISRGIVSGKSWNEIADKLSRHMEHTPFNRAKNNAMRIVRTEGHRVQMESQNDAMHKAKDKGADIVKQWDATLDGRTRPTHRMLDGQIRELDEAFEVNGNSAMYPSNFGIAAEDCNCRCACLQRARWALDEDELQILKDRAAFFGLDKAKDFDDYKIKYLKTEKYVNAPEINDIIISKSKNNFQSILDNSFGEINHVKRMSMYSEYTEYIENKNINSAFLYSVEEDVIYYNSKIPNFKLYDMNYVQAHELSHRMDILEYESFNNKEFLNAIDICRNKIMDNEHEIQSWFDKGGKYENDFAISDIVSALSLNSIEVPIGHDNSYWEEPNNIALEIFANISSIDVIGNSSKSEFESVLAELYEAYKEIVK